MNLALASPPLAPTRGWSPWNTCGTRRCAWHPFRFARGAGAASWAATCCGPCSWSPARRGFGFRGGASGSAGSLVRSYSGRTATGPRTSRWRRCCISRWACLVSPTHVVLQLDRPVLLLVLTVPRVSGRLLSDGPLFDDHSDRASTAQASDFRVRFGADGVLDVFGVKGRAHGVRVTWGRVAHVKGSVSRVSLQVLVRVGAFGFEVEQLRVFWLLEHVFGVQPEVRKPTVRVIFENLSLEDIFMIKPWAIWPVKYSGISWECSGRTWDSWSGWDYHWFCWSSSSSGRLSAESGA